MEVILENKTFGSELEEFGLCGKELQCQSCRVDIIEGYDKLEDPKVDEEDIFIELGPKHYKEGLTRMSCQIKVSKRLEGALIEVPREAFGDV